MRPVVVNVDADSTHTKEPRSWRYLAGAGLTASTKLRRQSEAVKLLSESDDRSRRSACHRRTCVDADCDAQRVAIAGLGIRSRHAAADGRNATAEVRRKPAQHSTANAV